MCPNPKIPQTPRITSINNANFKNSMIGNFVTFEGKQDDLSIGDYNTMKWEN